MRIHISKKPLKLRPTLTFMFVLCLALVIDFSAADSPNLFFVRNAEARIGRPASPGSVAGVRRRTRRRTVHRVARGTRVYALPTSCTTVISGGMTYHRCSGVYYRPYYEGNTVVYVVENP